MPYIQLDDTQFPLRVGAVRVGAAGVAEIPLPGVADPRALAIVEVSADHGAAIRRAHDAAAVRVNGVPLGVEPAPLLHGDKIEIGTHELLYGDDRKAGSTQFLPSMGTPAASRVVAQRPARPTAATGGRLVSLVDGREYHVSASGLTIGRDAGCDVVVGSSEVSRRHAQLQPSSDGYVLRDVSTNGVWVNGTRVEQQTVLGRADIVRVGGEEFRFYADAVDASAAVAGADAAIGSGMPAQTAAAPDPVMLGSPLAALMPPSAAAPAASDSAPTGPGPAYVPGGGAPRAPLASFEVVGSGVLKGQRFDVRHPLVNIGRGEHNDVVLPDESVSDSHAKLQKRDGRWFVVDVQSTNGTYVGGERLTGEREITAGATVRVGGVKLLFSTVSSRMSTGRGTRVITGAALDPVRGARTGAPAAPRLESSPGPDAAAGRWTLRTWILLVLTIGAIAFLLLQGR